MADTRIVVHIINTLQQGMNTVKVRTADTDVIAILTGVFFDMKLSHPHADIWVAFGTGKSFKYLSINAISSHIGVVMVRALPMFHALTQHQHLKEEVKRQHGTHGRPMKRSQKPLVTWLLTSSNA